MQATDSSLFQTTRSLSFCARIGSIAAALAVVALVAAPTLAAPQTLNAKGDPAGASVFVLDFGNLGGARSANITSTNFLLVVDEAALEAHFDSYLQFVDPILLPGDISTGDLTIEIVPGTSTGTYDPATGIFSTSETHRIHFTGDLSAYGLTSPVDLPSSSSGTVVHDFAWRGTIALDWDGVGQLADPFNPGQFIDFSYRCDVDTTFNTRSSPVSQWSHAAADTIEASALPDDLKTQAVGLIDTAWADSLAGRTDDAVDGLDTLIDLVEAWRGQWLTDGEADTLVQTADDVIAGLTGEVATPVGGAVVPLR